MATAVARQPAGPYVNATKDTITTSDGNVEVTVTFYLVGTVSQVQADWTTLTGATITATSARVQWDGGQL